MAQHPEEIIDLAARFTWDNGRGETQCSRTYLERREFQRLAFGRAAEARLLGKEELAADYEAQGRRLALELEDLRRAGHVGASRFFHAEGFRVFCVNTEPGDLKLV